MLLQTALAISILVQISGSESIADSACKGPGVNPHPYDSKQLLICANDHGKLLVTETVPCPEGYVYSVSEKTCVRGQQIQPASPSTNSRITRAAAAGPCKASGPYCEDCDRLVICTNMGDHVLSALANISCSEVDPDMVCSKASCTTATATTPRCEGSDQAGAFRCLQPGFFPDPTSCKLYHVCGSDLSHFSGDCDEQFNADRGICTSMDSDTAPSGPPVAASDVKCTNIDNGCTGDNTAPRKFPSYPSYYLICIPVATKSRKSTYVYQVSVAKCPESQVFNDQTQMCEMTCAGKRGRFADPDNCRSYYECTANSPAVKKSCPENQAFDKGRKLCLPESMVQGCQRTRAVDTSTPNITTITQAITPSPPPAILPSPLPAITQTIPTVGFQCRASGLFPDDSDCHRYISCSLESRSDGVYFHMRRKRCPFLTFFNPRGFCQVGFCWN